MLFRSVVDSNAEAAAVSAVCQQRLLSAGVLSGDAVGHGADRNAIHIGDRIQTRRNTAELTTSDGTRVLNRDVWRVSGRRADGSVTAVHVARGSRVVITPDYLGQHVALAYATTIAGAQGRTVERGHVLVTPRTSAESLYVGMTRGRASNVAHVVCDRHDHEELGLGDRTPVQAFAAALGRVSDSGRSARSIAEQWEADRAVRVAARQADRSRVEASQWLSTHGIAIRQPRLRKFLEANHVQVVAALAGCVNDVDRVDRLRRGLAALRDSRPGTHDGVFFTAFQAAPAKSKQPTATDVYRGPDRGLSR